MKEVIKAPRASVSAPVLSGKLNRALVIAIASAEQIQASWVTCAEWVSVCLVLGAPPSDTFVTLALPFRHHRAKWWPGLFPLPSACSPAIFPLSSTKAALKCIFRQISGKRL